MSTGIDVGGLHIDGDLYRLVEDEIAPGTGVDAAAFWVALEGIVRDLEPRNRALLEQRDALQAQIDDWHRGRGGQVLEGEQYRAFLAEIGYLLPEGESCQVTSEQVDAEIAQIAGPQLVVPVDNARYALNAANARWGSLFDALYGTDVIGEEDGAERGSGYNPERGDRVVDYALDFLDQAVPLAVGSYESARAFSLQDSDGVQRLVVKLGDGVTTLEDEGQFVGYEMDGDQLTRILLRHHGLHIEIQIDRRHPVGAEQMAGIKDVLLEAAITTIQDCEDSVAAVDAEDKVRVYRNWNGLMRGNLETTFAKDGRPLTRRLAPDRTFTALDGSTGSLPGRSLLLVRNVGPHMYTDCATCDGREIPESFLDLMVTSLAAVHDLRQNSEVANSRSGSVYIVKPKFHGPDEIALAVELFGRVEEALGLSANTLKMGIMDEERRTTVNLTQAIARAHQRVVFINTGFLDRTGDEIHTSMEAGAVFPKAEIRDQPWLQAYEDQNVDIGLETGLKGRGQIGKGMWTMPDLMRDMVATKAGHPQAGATTAWVPSPTAAVLHALHYHQVDVAGRQAELASRGRASLDAILTPPLLDRDLTAEAIQAELDNNAQGILGYVVRWVDQGIGCSKVADMNNVGLMEDRATLRISSQHIANWLHHGLVNRDQVRATFERMAQLVDQQNEGDAAYRPMAPGFDDSIAFQAALDLVFEGRDEPNGYTERVLHTRRRQVKAQEG
ncbi:MAG: malate synthase G [Candidatus Latescibacteria bacterium]|nr:malate synthase G [Candidatus Latescibacterota bacterium]